MVATQDGGSHEGQQKPDFAYLEGSGSEAPSAGALYGFNDPKFEEKAAEIIGLYLNPPQNAAVFCVDEKSAMQALDRLDRRLPLSPGRAEKHGFEYHRHGTLSLYAALNPQTGEVIGQTAARHTSQEFVTFLEVLLMFQTPGLDSCFHARAHRVVAPDAATKKRCWRPWRRSSVVESVLLRRLRCWVSCVTHTCQSARGVRVVRSTSGLPDDTV